MKLINHLLFSIIVSSLVVSCFGQSIDIIGSYSRCDEKIFNSAWGYGIGYNHNLGMRNRIGISVNRATNSTQYDEIYRSWSNGHFVVQQVIPKNNCIALKLHWARKIVNTQHSSLLLGANISLNYFFIKKEINQIASEYFTERTYSGNYQYNSRLGVGCFIEYEINEIVNKQLSSYLTIHPEATNFKSFGLMGTHEPTIIGWMNCSIGLRYNLKTEEPNNANEQFLINQILLKS